MDVAVETCLYVLGCGYPPSACTCDLAGRAAEGAAQTEV